MNIIEHNNLVDANGFLNPLLGRYRNGTPNPDDLVHLGNRGIRYFVRNFKNKILHRRSSPTGRAQPPNPATKPQHTVASTTPPWSGGSNHTSGSIYPMGSHFPPPPFPGWHCPPFPSPSPPFTLPSLGPTAGVHQSDRNTFNTHFPSLTDGGSQL